MSVAYFSLILPIYNVEKYLRRCVESILEQGFNDYEIILVDDGSTDESSAICDKYAALYEFIKVIHKDNGGLSSARNEGLKIANGKYIWWIDSDDWIEKEALETLFDICSKQMPDIVKFNYFYKQEISKTNVFPIVYQGEINGVLVSEALLHPTSYCLSAWSHVYRKDFLTSEDLRFVSERTIASEDYLFNLQALLVASKIFVIESALYNYEYREGSLSQSYRKDLIKKYVELYHRLHEFYDKENALDKYESKLCRFFIWHLIHGTCFPNEYENISTNGNARKDIREFMKSRDCQYAIKKIYKKDFQWKYKIQLFAIKHQIESLFYYLYVIKPRIKKVVKYENKDKV